MASEGKQVLKEKIPFEGLMRVILDASKACGGPSHEDEEEYAQ